MSFHAKQKVVIGVDKGGQPIVEIWVVQARWRKGKHWSFGYILPTIKLYDNAGSKSIKSSPFK